TAEADGVVVKEGDRRWQAESGQYLLGFENDPAPGSLEALERQEAAPPASAEDWFERGAALETPDPAPALAAYESALAADPRLLKARINLGCLLHETGRLERAEKVYRVALLANGHDPVLLYDLGVLLDDLGRKREAAQAYESALRDDPGFA